MNFKRYHASKNLFDKNATYTSGINCYKYTITGLTPNQYYTCSTNFVSQGINKEASLYFNGSSTPTNGVDANTPRSFICDDTGTMTIDVRFREYPQTNPAIYDDLMNGTVWIMLNEGSTALPYEPYSSEVWHDLPHYIHKTDTETITTPAVIYANDTTLTVGLKGNMVQSGIPSPDSPIQPSECGDLETTGEHTGQYKIPILNNSTTTNVYLGEVQTTRKIKKLVLDGTETWYTSSNTGVYYTTKSASLNPIYSLSICNRFVYHFVNSVSALAHGEYLIDMINKYTWLRNNDITSLQDWKTYLQQQYAAGTPVTVWYVLAKPQTAVVNEPLRKIGTYADEVSDISISTIAGVNTLSVDTTLQPSEVTATYKGWHPVADVHEYNSNYTIATMQALTIAQLQEHTISDLQGGEWS